MAETATVVRSRRKWKRKLTDKVATVQQYNRMQREAIIEGLELIDLKISSNTKSLREVLRLLQDYLDRGQQLLLEGRKRETLREIGMK